MDPMNRHLHLLWSSQPAQRPDPARRPRLHPVRYALASTPASEQPSGVTTHACSRADMQSQLKHIGSCADQEAGCHADGAAGGAPASPEVRICSCVWPTAHPGLCLEVWQYNEEDPVSFSYQIPFSLHPQFICFISSCLHSFSSLQITALIVVVISHHCLVVISPSPHHDPAHPVFLLFHRPWEPVSLGQQQHSCWMNSASMDTFFQIVIYLSETIAQWWKAGYQDIQVGKLTFPA